MKFISSRLTLYSTGTFKIQYTAKHTNLFLEQVQTNVISGFTPNSTSPDANFGKCLQCAAIDRARYKVTPTIARSDFCTTCFQQYCFNSSNPPSQTEIVGRKYAFVDPDPQGVSKVEGFLGEHKTPLIVGLVFLVLTIIVIVFGLYVFLDLPGLVRRTLIFFLRRRWWKNRRDRKYKRLTMQAEESDAPWKAYSDRLGSFELPAREQRKA